MEPTISSSNGVSQQELINTGKICPYCFNETIFTDSKEIYGKSHGPIYLCRPCEAYIGVHEGTKNATGRLANAELRFWKQEVRAFFDPIWAANLNQGMAKHKVRHEAYEWLTKEMGLENKFTPIGHFDVDMCKQAIAICKAANPGFNRLDTQTKIFGTESIDKTKRLFRYTGSDRVDQCLKVLKNKYGPDLWYDEKKYCYTIETKDAKGLLIIDFYSKADKVLVRRENSWKVPGLNWLITNM